ncbi:Glycine--tRNA ligase [Mycoplasmopsis agalactiae]|uniref:Glycine--tRNA ligase n=1 Tax=Mycoplasmopsis agalactiae (strain NCTC 10123 / CIP 59.7 / PG2) TaxID=347257 RepID=A5IY56_MYCAP|nr:glycine--tRNA ligase [Mycoplasmopsis agalactiae]MCE6057038.1 glycine--tRNA ligase [Mycoplasmopsis agalactiae]MCE6078824.1 glycine--tRNA ligase [Mycoplasmopsis agalactiae]MCE6095208.1 glycine--tRNA ligase [Mycoplasmopsis agalactiae]MCE6114464.1 glycine--tRNA ligase [Mycoplasmopsis agalactiae]NLS34299.1 glycine--tRNA ligase [Mycoplasmopsis agalactiae]
MNNKDKNMASIINHLKATGFVFQGSEIYGGLSNTWDYGPLGSLLKENIKDLWKKEFIYSEHNNFLIDSKILMNPKVWVTSGHVSNFNDPLIENKVNGKRYRADKIIQEIVPSLIPEAMTFKQMHEYLVKNVTEYDNSKCNWSEIRKFNLMFETKQGIIEGEKSLIYLRPETAQGIFVNFKNVLRSTRAKLPIGIGQVGKSFRNEVTPGNFIFRTREFEQMELEVFHDPKDSELIFNKYLNKCKTFANLVGIKDENIRIRAHEQDELSHYSSATSDIEYLFPFGWGELLGVANRTDFDLKAHMQATGESLEYFDPVTNSKLIPYVIEPSMGLDRLMLALLIDSYDEELVSENDTRIVLKVPNGVAPYKFAILPLVKKLNEKAEEIYKQLLKLNIPITYDDAGSIGKRYRRQDSIGTPYCITIDYDSLNDECITIRNRDSMSQERISISNLYEFAQKTFK